MKRVLNFVLMFFAFGFMLNAQDALVTVNGTVTDEVSGNPVQNHDVLVIIGDSLSGGGIYQLTTNEQGYYEIADIATAGYGEAQAIVYDCNFIPQVQEGIINPGPNTFNFDFAICIDSIPQGDCSNTFWFETNDMLTYTFYGESYPVAADNYLWDFGDGSTGSGQQVSHTYTPNSGDVVTVTLTTILYDPAIGDSCMATSEQEIYLGNPGGGDCENWFAYETVSDNTLHFYGFSTPLPADEYLWDFGDGTTGVGEDIEHSFDPNLGDMFTVTLTTIAYDSIGDTCIANSAQEVWVFNGGGTGDCENWFWYDTYDNITFSFYGESYPVAADQYVWDFGDGETGSGQEVEHTFDTSLGDLFTVTLTTYGYDPATGDSCSAISMQEVWVGGNSGGDCDNMFWYEMSGDFTFDFAGESFPIPAGQYIWDFGDGTTTTGQQVTHTFDPSLGDLFTVCLTTYSYDPVTDSCVAISCQDVQLSGQMGQQLMGTVYVQGEPADYALVGLFGMDSSGTFVYDFVMTEPQTGTYFFDNVPEGEYYLVASLTPQSPEFVNYFPTYYGDALFWFDATVIELGAAANPYDINLIPISSYNAGDGNIGGTVTIGEGKGNPANNVSVLLMDENENALTYKTTNEDGVFDFSDLAYGTYKLKVEIPGKNSEIATVVIDDENQGADIDFVVTSSIVVLTAVPGFERLTEAGEIYPNPVYGDASLELTLTESVDVTVSVYNQTGQIVSTGVQHLNSGRQLLKINSADLQEGVYYVNILSENGGVITRKLVKIR